MVVFVSLRGCNLVIARQVETVLGFGAQFGRSWIEAFETLDARHSV